MWRIATATYSPGKSPPGPAPAVERDELEADHPRWRRVLLVTPGDLVPVVSVVVTCHNHGRFLRDAVESVRQQTFRDFEIVVVDDGSVDDTPTVVANLQGIHCIRQAHQGLPAARNTGWRASRGNYLVFLDADDRLLPDALQSGVDHVRAHPTAAFVSGHYVMIDADGVQGSMRDRPCVTSDHYGALLRSNYIGMHATVVYRRETLRQFGGFDPSLPACEDYDLYLRVARLAPVVCHPDLVAEYRWHGGNLSRNNALMLGSVLHVLRRQRRHVRGHARYEDAYREGLAYWRHAFGDSLLWETARGVYTGASWFTTMRMLTILLRYYPGGLARGAAKTARRLSGFQ
jgi:glycosyltransferase involved in cell wall biosynthesis